MSAGHEIAQLRSRGFATTLAPPTDAAAPVTRDEARAPEPEPAPVGQPPPDRPWIARFLGSR